jgi:hypothetical protein
VRRIEKTDARVVVPWRYVSIEVGYVFRGADVWVDEYCTIDPDGVGVRFVDISEHYDSVSGAPLGIRD